MTAEDFIRWWTDLKVRFPSVRAWIAKHAPESQDQQATLKTWREVLADVELPSALAVTAKMQAGELPWLAEFEPIDKLPQHVRRLAKDATWKARGIVREQLPDDYRPSTFPAGRILKRWIELEASGMDHDEAKAQALREFPIGHPSRDERFNCGQCRDERRILVASKSAIRAMLDGTFDRCHHRVGVMRCRCDNSRRDERRPLETFNPELDFRVDNDVWKPERIEEFRLWVEFQLANNCEHRAKACAGYDADFASFNNREF